MDYKSATSEYREMILESGSESEGLSEFLHWE